MDKKNRQYAAAGAGLLLVSAILQVSARMTAGFAAWYTAHIYPALMYVIGGFFGMFPFSVVELCLYALTMTVIIYTVHFIKKPLRLLARGFFLIAAILFLYTVNCGVNYYAKSFSEYAELDTELYTKEELQELCDYLVVKVNETAIAERYADHKKEWIQEGITSMQKAGAEFPPLRGFYPRPKPVLVSRILSKLQLAGVYDPFTIEANFNQEMTDYNIPHTICHELSHLKGFMREDEANFIGYLACTGSDNQAFQYSGYLTGLVHAGNALAKVDPEAYVKVWQELSEQARADMKANNEFWGQFEGKAAEVANQWNDTYLKSNNQAEGVQSYGRMVDLMLAYRRK